MKYIYNIGVKAYSILVWLASPFSPKAGDWIRGRKNLTDTIRKKVSPAEKYLWMHCASLGEFEQGRPLTEHIRSRVPGLKIVLTFFSPSGYNVRKDYAGADHVFYLPADTPANAEAFISSINPVAAIFIKYEFWYNYLSLLHSRDIPVILASAIFRPEQHFFRPCAGFSREMLSFVSHFFVQDSSSQQLLEGIGLGDRVSITGDTRFDRVAEIRSLGREIPVLRDFAGDDRVMVCGSTWPEDENIIAEYRRLNPGRLKYIIAPHETDARNIARVSRLFGKGVTLMSASEKGVPADADVMLIDCIGILSTAYRYGHLALVGGGFGKGIHNILEAAVWGIPLMFGPAFGKFREAVELKELGGAKPFSGYDQFAAIAGHWLENEEDRLLAGRKCETYTRANAGATETVTTYLLGLLEDSGSLKRG